MEIKEDKPILILQKNAEHGTNKIRIPKNFIEKHGNRYLMEIYDDKIKLRPIEKRKEE